MYPSLVTSIISVSSGDEGTGLSLFSFADYTDQGETNNREWLANTEHNWTQYLV